MKTYKGSRGFTLIELLVVITIISILAVGVFVALNPTRKFYESRNARRVTDVNNILTAIHECIVDEGGNAGPCVGTLGTTVTVGTTYELGTAASGCGDVCTGVADDDCLDIGGTRPGNGVGNYLRTLPTDPGGVTTGHTEYSFTINSDNMVTITACSAENGVTVEASR